MTRSETEKLLAHAFGHHQAGRLPQAEALYRQVLLANPNHVVGLQFLGILVHQAGRHAAAAELLGKAIALNGRDPDCHYNIGAVFQVLGRLEEAAAHYSKAIALKADFAEAFYELGNVLARQDKPGEAAAQYQRALVLRPNFVEALTNLGSVLREEGKQDEAMARWRQALALQPQYAVALMNIGLVLKQQGKLDEAVAYLRQAVSVPSGPTDAQFNLGALLEELGQRDEARAAYRRAFELGRRWLAAKETPEIMKSLVARCLCSPLVDSGLGDLRDLMVQALSEPWARPSDLAPAGVRLLPLNAAIRDGMARAATAWPNLLPVNELAGSMGLAAIAEDRLLRALLESTAICEVGLERFATGLRFTLLAAAGAGTDSAAADTVLSLYGALARQCFINNYVFTQSGAEMEEALRLRDMLATALASGTDIPVLLLVAVAAYFPLHTLPGAGLLLDRPWPDAVTAVLAQQVREPLEEQRLRASMPVLTAIEDIVSVQVRGQYEEHPYPQWVKMAPAGKPKTVDTYIRQKFPHSVFVELGKKDDIDVLVAGCGTGRHPIETVSRFKIPQVTAVDLSLISLCYAQRQTSELGLNTIHYAQADILHLPSIGRTFDVIESVGVLHHLADPFVGWRALLSILRPGGIMKLGFYSEIARREFAAARDLIAARGYRATADDIRRFRQEAFDAADGTPLKNVTNTRDFYSLSECRDLLFHVQEHRLALPEIGAFIVENNLQFLGFDIDPQVQRSYARRFPDDIAMTDLAQWHRYETDNPRTFIQMYQFWVQNT